MTVKELIKELKKEAKKNGIFESEVDNGGSIREYSFLLWTIDEKGEMHCFKVGYLNPRSGKTVKPFICNFD